MLGLVLMAKSSPKPRGVRRVCPEMRLLNVARFSVVSLGRILGYLLVGFVAMFKVVCVFMNIMVEHSFIGTGGRGDTKHTCGIRTVGTSHRGKREDKVCNNWL